MDELSEADSAALLDGEIDPYGADDLGITWAEKRHHLLLLDDDGRLVGHAGWIPVEMEAEDGPLSGVGLGGVLVHRDRRGGGIGTVLVSEAAERMRRLGRPFGFLFCRSVRVPFYERNGWHRTANQVVVDQPSGPLVMPLETCWTAFTPGASLPDSELRLRALPF